MDWFIGKARRKDKDPSPSQQEEQKQYLHSAMLESTTSEIKLREIVNLSEGLDYNEWLASHTIAFFEHINLLYGTISEFCSMSGCPDMSGPCNRQYLWIDEKGKRTKLTAPQYVNYVMTYSQKAINDESIFPTKFNKEFPSTFVLTVKKIMKLLYHVVAHIYHSHFKEIVLLNLHPHLNCIFAHMVLFNERFKLIEEKEVEVLHDLAVALKLYPPKLSNNFIDATIHFNEGAIDIQRRNEDDECDDSNNNITMASDYYHEDVITTQCRSISALDDYRNFETSDDNLEYLNDQKENQHDHNRMTEASFMNINPNDIYCVNSPMLVDENFIEDSKTLFQVSSPEPMMVEPMMSSENTPKKCVFDIKNSLRERSISANAVLGSSKSLEAFPVPPITRRSNSDRTSAKNSLSESHFHTKRLHDDLFSDYNRLIRPSKNHSYKLTVNIGLKLTQIIDINLRQQVMTTNIWLEQNWYDYKLTWNPKDYGGVDMINVPAENIWLPDIVLFNNADGNYEVTLMTKATVYNTGLVVWNPPALYKSTCKIDIEYFPFDEQSCLMKFASWTYDGHEVDIRHVKQEEGSTYVDVGIDLSKFYKSVEWDILMVPAKYNEEYYECCPEPYPDITFNLTMRRKTLFYTVNLIIPCVGITFLTLVVFYLPSDSGEKVTLSISILVALTVFFLLLAEIIPPTSLAIPLLGKYLLFTMILDTLSICVTVGVLNVHFRSPSTHIMTSWIRKVFIHILPRILLMKRPSSQDWHAELAAIGKKNRGQSKKGFETQGTIPTSSKYSSRLDSTDSYHQITGQESICMSGSPKRYNSCVYSNRQIRELNQLYEQNYSQLRQIFNLTEIQKAIKGIIHLADHIRKDDEDNNIIEDWKYVAMVLDRLFLWIFSLAVFCGTCGIILQAPSLYDTRVPIESELTLVNPLA